MTRRIHLNQRTALERLYVGGPELASKIPEHVRRGLAKLNLVEYAGINGLLTIRLSAEGNYYMGASHEDLDNDAAYWRRKTGESID